MMQAPETKVIHKIALAYFKDKQILAVRTDKNDEVFYAVGGKVEPGETDIDCLKREVKEELGVDLKPKSIKFLHEFIGPAHGKNKGAVLNMKFYQAEIVGKPKPTSEVVEIRYLDSQTDPKHFSEISRTQIFPWFKEHGYIN